jgi:hypothetical protein
MASKPSRAAHMFAPRPHHFLHMVRIDIALADVQF